MARGTTRGARRGLLGLIVLVLVLGGLLAGTHVWGTAGLTPKLGLDLKGGSQLVLSPIVTGGQQVTTDRLNQARDIIVQRVDANGVSGAEVTTTSDNKIVVSIPETPNRATLDAIRKSSQMQFRGVLCATGSSAQPTWCPSTTPVGPAPAPTATASGTATVKPTTKPSGGGAEAPSATTVPRATASSTKSSAKSAIPQGLRNATTPTPTGTATSAASTPTPAASTPGDGVTTAGTGAAAASPTDPNSQAWVTAAVAQQYAALNCTAPGALEKIVDDPKKPLVTCSTDGQEKYILGPVIVGGDSIGDANAGYQVSSTGATTSVVEIQLSFKGAGKQAYVDASKRMVSLPDPQNRMAATLDSQVIVAPRFDSAIPDGNASITGSFTIASARDLAQQLKFGALPLSFQLETQTQISPTLGSDQLRLGLIAGLIGLLLVVVYSLFQYRALGLVTVASLLVASGLTYLSITLLGWSHNYRLDMAGVTGCIVAIGVTADSFIVYFERVRDEVREGRALRSAVETGWRRARRTILAADGVNFLAAFVLYTLATANVRGFAFTLGLTTIIDLVVVMLFTHPTVALLAGSRFFGGGHKWSGLDPVRLGAKAVRYAGRGRVAVDPPRRPVVPVDDNEGAVL